MRTRKQIAVLFGVFLATCLTGCKKDSKCEAGRQVECACPGGTKGVQVCLPDASGFGACGCGTGAPAAATSGAAPAPGAGEGSAGARALLKDYFSQADCVSRLKIIRYPERNEALLKANYKGQENSCKADLLDVSDTCGNVKVGDWCWVTVHRMIEGTKVKTEYEVNRQRDGFKVDWRSSVGWNPMTMTAFKAQMPKTPTVLRVPAKLDTYYNYEFGNAQKTHYSIRLLEWQKPEHLNGYIAKDAPDAARLFEILKDGEQHYVMVEVQYGANARDNGIVIINRLVADNWRQTDAEK